jgi:hypothetical protein
MGISEKGVCLMLLLVWAASSLFRCQDNDATGHRTCEQLAEECNVFETQNNSCVENEDCTVIYTSRVWGRNCYLVVNVDTDPTLVEALDAQYGRCSLTCGTVCPCTPPLPVACVEGRCEEAPL